MVSDPASPYRLVASSNFETSSGWRPESFTFLEAVLTDRLAHSVGCEVRYASEPVGDHEDTDTTMRVALVLNFSAGAPGARGRPRIVR